MLGALVVEAALEGDESAARMVEVWGQRIGIGVANAIHTFDPEEIVIGGDAARAGALLLEPARRVARGPAGPRRTRNRAGLALRDRLLPLIRELARASISVRLALRRHPLSPTGWVSRLTLKQTPDRDERRSEAPAIRSFRFRLKKQHPARLTGQGQPLWTRSGRSDAARRSLSLCLERSGRDLSRDVRLIGGLPRLVSKNFEGRTRP